jgi:hypothetical protein
VVGDGTVLVAARGGTVVGGAPGRRGWRATPCMSRLD